MDKFWLEEFHFWSYVFPQLSELGKVSTQILKSDISAPFWVTDLSNECKMIAKVDFGGTSAISKAISPIVFEIIAKINILCMHKVEIYESTSPSP